MMSRTNICMESFPALLGAALISLVLSTAAVAANPEPVTVEVEFIAPVTIAETNALAFGMLDVAMLVAQTVAIATDSTVTDVNNNVVGPAPA